jgi:hypothetical protein
MDTNTSEIEEKIASTTPLIYKSREIIRSQIITWFQKLGYITKDAVLRNSNYDFHWFLKRYCEYKLITIQWCPRDCHFSKTFINKQSSLQDSFLLSHVQELITKIEKGINLYPHLSRRIYKPKPITTNSIFTKFMIQESSSK